MAVRYKPEVHDFIRTHLDQFTIQEMAEEVNRRFGTDFNYGNMKAYYNNHKLKTGKRQTIRSKLWPEDVVEVLLANYKGRTYAEMLEILREETGREYTQAQLKCYYHNHKLNSGQTGRFEKGHEPGNKGKKLEEYIGEERAAEIKKADQRHPVQEGRQAYERDACRIHCGELRRVQASEEADDRVTMGALGVPAQSCVG